LRACFIGRLVPYKGPDMLIEAARPLLQAGQMTLEILGDGPMMPMLRAQAEGLPGVTFHGWVDHARVRDVAGGCSVLSFPSVREFGGGVVLEAMAMGLVPLIVDYAGPAELVAPDTAVTVPLADRDAIVAGFRAALARMAADPEGVARMGQTAQARVMERFTWAAKAGQVAQVYDWVLGRRPERPDFSRLAEASVDPHIGAEREGQRRVV
jgi:glycosyltransferase involved in cell wall biosynthesis